MPDPSSDTNKHSMRQEGEKSAEEGEKRGSR